MKWTDSYEIAVALHELYPAVDPQYVRFPRLHGGVTRLMEFDGEPGRSSERILEAIQMAWLAEVA